MKNFLLFSFVFLILSSSQAQIAQMLVIGKPQKSPDEFVGKRDVNGRVCAAIQVISDMDGFKYDAYNGVVAVDHRPGRDVVYLSPDERVLEIFHSGYEPLKLILSDYGIQLRSKEVWKIKIKGQTNTGDLLPVTIFVQPTDAHITVDGKTAQSGKAIELSRGSHRLLIRKEGFNTIDKTIFVSKDQVVFNETLSEQDLVAVQIRSIPQGAQIYMDGLDRGTTDKGIWLYPGTYSIKLIKPGYSEINQTISVVEGGNNVFNFTLTKNSGTLILDITPSGTTVLINKEDYSGRSRVDLAPGRYKIEIAKTGYRPLSEKITIKRGQTLHKSYSLTAKTGKLRFSVQPLTAKVTLKQNGLVVQSWTGMKYLKDLPVGNYELECAAPGYVYQTKQIIINEEKTTVLDIKMRKNNQSFSSTEHESSFSFGYETGTVTDIDGNVYKTIKIGNQWWMAENLRVTHYRNGDAIPNKKKGKSFLGFGDSGWDELKTGAYCNYDNDPKYVQTYGRLYNWYAISDHRNIAPEGWHVPTDEEWQTLIDFLGGNSVAGGKMKERGTTHWSSPNKGATNQSKFSSLPSGYRDDNGSFGFIRDRAYYWSATKTNKGNAWGISLYFYRSDAGHHPFKKQYGFSVRCVRD